MATIKVGMADLKICKAPDMVTTLGLGSCIGIAMYDPVLKEPFKDCQICRYRD